MPPRVLTTLAVYNEAPYVNGVLDQVRLYSGDVLVVDDGSTDTTAELLAARDDICVVTHDQNRGYGAALTTAFDFADGEGYNVVVTIDCDGQHEPQRIPHFIDACRDVDIVSGSRYLKQFTGDSQPPADRRRCARGRYRRGDERYCPSSPGATADGIRPWRCRVYPFPRSWPGPGPRES